MTVLVFVGENVARDLDQVRIELAPVPLGEDLVHLRRLHSQAVAHQLVGLADELHVAVLDAVVHHFDIVTRAVFADPVAAGRAVHLGGDCLEDRLDVRPRGGRSAGHDRGAEARPLLAARDAGADVEQTFRFDIGGAADRVMVIRVAAVDDHIARLQKRDQLPDEIVDRLPCLNQQHHAARFLQQADQFRKGMGALDPGALRALAEELVHPGESAVEDRHGESMVVHVQHQVLSHNRQADQSDIRFAHFFVPFHRNRR